MNIISKYYLDGFLKCDFKSDKSLDKLNKVLLDFHNSDSLPKEFSWEEKYPNTKDLRPCAFDIDSIFLDILFDNNIPDLIKNTIGSDLTLSHIQIRKAKPGPSYMDWHRDSYLVDGNIVGNLPPVHKIIFYPKTTKGPEKKLSILKGSHLCILNQPMSNYLAPGISIFDKQLFQVLENVSYESSSSEFILFNTSALHAVVPDKDVNGSIRVIYSFVHPSLYEEKYSHKDIHSRLNKEYEKRRGSHK